MAFLAVDENGEEWIYSSKPFRTDRGTWLIHSGGHSFLLPVGTIAKLIRGGLTWEDDPVELKDEK